MYAPPRYAMPVSLHVSLDLVLGPVPELGSDAGATLGFGLERGNDVGAEGGCETAPWDNWRGNEVS